mmetsp:Transcript_93267/g.300257  ORF Transcript_93267/g.300257 Transcript_93267/m.300257 type:complete len:154 (-) Transcript_93267:74-535(-)
MAFREQVKFQRKAFPWTAAQSVETQKQSFGPVPISSSGGHVTWRVEGYVSLHGNQADPSIDERKSRVLWVPTTRCHLAGGLTKRGTVRGTSAVGTNCEAFGWCSQATLRVQQGRLPTSRLPFIEQALAPVGARLRFTRRFQIRCLCVCLCIWS